MSQAATGAIGGIGQGVAAGAAFGPVGMAVGGVLGGIGGLLGGSAADKAAMYMRRAAKFERRSKAQQVALQRRDLLRTSRIAQAEAIAMAASEAGGLQSSTTQGARASAASQLGFSLGYMENQYTLQRAVTKNLEKAGQYSAQSQDIFSLTSSLASAASVIGPRIPRTPPTTGVTPSGVQPAFSPSAGIGLRGILDVQLTSPSSR